MTMIKNRDQHCTKYSFCLHTILNKVMGCPWVEDATKSQV